MIGAGQAGLSAAYHLQRAGFVPGESMLVLDAGARPGGAWQHRWPSLRLGSAHGIHSLPGMEFTEPDLQQPASTVVAEYFDEYEHRFDLEVLRPVPVTSVTRDGERLVVSAPGADFAARAVVNATGTWTSPFVPYYPGIDTFRGRQLHTADYRSATEFDGQHVLVVGGGTSAVQLLIEIAQRTTTSWVTRRPPVWREGFDSEAGRAAVARVDARVRQGLSPGSVVSVTGLPLTPAVRQAQAAGILDRLPIFDRITPTGVSWRDGRELAVDVILWCTGFRASLDHLAPLHIRESGGGITMNGTQVVREPRLHLVGYGPSASTIGANRAGRAAARIIARSLA